MTNITSPLKPIGRAPVSRDMGFAVGIAIILGILFLPIPPILTDIGLAISVALSVVILMVALWIEKPLHFSSFPTVLLIATMLRLALNIATTRLILSHGHEGTHAAGSMIEGFAYLVMSGDFVIGLIIFVILVTVNFIVITKGASRIAEVGARFTLDAIPGKQMAIDADLAAGTIDDKEAQLRRRELEEESAFFGAMDGASKFVRGDAIAGLIITSVNVFGGIVIGATRHDMPLSEAADVYVKLSVGDGLVTQIPALIVSLAAGLLVSKGGTQGATNAAVIGQISAQPRALTLAGFLLLVIAVVPGLPFLPFALLSALLLGVGIAIPRKEAARRAAMEVVRQQEEEQAKLAGRDSVKDTLRTAEIELVLGKQLAVSMLSSHSDLAHRVSRMRRKFAEQYGFVVPEVRLSDNIAIDPKSYQIRIHGTVVASHALRIGDLLVLADGDSPPDVPVDETREPAYGMKAWWVAGNYQAELKRQSVSGIDNMSVMLTHLSETVRNNLPQLLSYKDMRALLDRLDPEYKRLVDDICPSNISFSGLQGILKRLLSERVSVRNLGLILEAIAEIVPHVRRAEQIVEHVRLRMSQQICGDISEGGVLKVLRLGPRWDLVFHQSLKRDGAGDVVEFDVDPQLVEQFATAVSAAVRERLTLGKRFALLVTPDARPYVRMLVERMFPTLPVLSHAEIAKGVEVETLGSLS
ncbi:flagellar biosynthesis protein FlhA [Chthonobacter rhizosphaerae]|uniref:flagellar biosynthesis protein FlhA n=1 Tax=Chthonobacter rhizosphaerae TaxID=2735553 RepID=UPI0015EEC015|nr:flagellar biosynthesis protein FlhA [Chthonobacter rhizosphaerae]